MVLESTEGKYKVSVKAPDSETLLKAVTELVKVSGAMLGLTGLSMAALVAETIAEEEQYATTETNEDI